MNTISDSFAGMADYAPGRSPLNLSKRILLVEDDNVIRELSAKVLLRSGYHVGTAENGQTGWEALHGDSYDLLITDNVMPKLSGLELVKKVRSARWTLPVIIASGTLDTEELNRHQSLQIAATLLKPFTTDQLLETVKEVLRAENSAQRRIGVRFPMPAETFARVEPFQRWGLNE